MVRRSTDTNTIKWSASIIQVFGYAATAFGLAPLNMYLFLVGMLGWLIVGLRWNDMAMTMIHVIALAAMVIGLALT
ncbi:ubiquinone biosynthesis methyltransferase UbiE [Tateyamaria sp. ANG-S1]|nr:ubiquinone biosynthesis methyltransferase UbiE [Tateyamaria sp. ANG-S1]